jgi:hypothetical protein
MKTSVDAVHPVTLSEWCAANLEGGFAVLHKKWENATLVSRPVRGHHKVWFKVVLPSGETKSLQAQMLSLKRRTELGVRWTVAVLPSEGYPQQGRS